MKWKAFATGRGFDEGEDREVEEAYQEGMRKGYEKAMREMEDGRYGEREGGYSSGGSSRGGGYGEREGRMFDPFEGEYMYGERRGVKGTGPYSRYRR